MKLKLGRTSMQIIPECDADIAYLEDTIGILPTIDDEVPKTIRSARMQRILVSGTFALAYIEIGKEED